MISVGVTGRERGVHQSSLEIVAWECEEVGLGDVTVTGAAIVESLPYSCALPLQSCSLFHYAWGSLSVSISRWT